MQIFQMYYSGNAKRVIFRNLSLNGKYLAIDAYGYRSYRAPDIELFYRHIHPELNTPVFYLNHSST